MEAARLHLSKCHIVGNHMSRLIIKVGHLRDAIPFRDSDTLHAGWEGCSVLRFAVNLRASQRHRPCNSYTMGCPPVRGDNPRALARGLSYAQVDKHDINILYHIHQCRPYTSRDISC